MKSNFQIIVTGVFIGFAVLGVILFATYRGGNDAAKAVGNVVIWGTLDTMTVEGVLNEVRQGRSDFAGVTYVEKDLSVYGGKLVEAIASGTGPDAFLLREDEIVSRAGVISPIPFEEVSARAFRDAYVGEGDLFVGDGGILALPLTVDPLVLYYNRSMLSAAGVARPPAYWDEFFTIAPKIVVKDRAGNITRSAVSFGEFRNVEHAKEILLTLIFQAGRGIGATAAFPIAGASVDASAVEAAVRYFTEFSNPVKTVYSWSRALKGSRAAFLAGELAFYAGYASELSGLRAANPNLDFDLAPLPQSRDRREPLAFGRMLGIAVARGAQNPVGAAIAVRALAAQAPVARLSEATGAVPARRDLLSASPDDPYRGILYAAALSARGWHDPDPAASTRVFAELVESVTSGRDRLSDAVRAAGDDLSALYDGARN